MNTTNFKEMHWMASMIGNIDVGMVVLDCDYKIQAFNGFMEHHSNIHGQDAKGKLLFELFPELPEDWFRQKIETVKLLKNMAFTTWEQRPYIFKFKNYRPITGLQEFMFQNMTIIPLTSLTGEVEQISLIIYDVTDVATNSMALSGANSLLESLSRTDGLTQLNNRSYSEELIAKEFKRFKRSLSPSSLVILDIDHFKQVNDTHGHPVGDKVIQAVAKTISATQRDSDVSGRFGGEEFVVLLSDTTAEQALVFTERLRKQIENQVIALNGINVQVTVSLGICQLVPELDNYQQWLSHADQALYQAKQQGRNRSVTY